MNNTIYRQVAIDAVHKNYDTILDFKSDGRTVADSFEDIINDLPSAEPERKISRWSDFSDSLYCLECGKALMDYFTFTEDGSIREQPDFCPNCGAYMWIGKE